MLAKLGLGGSQPNSPSTEAGKSVKRPSLEAEKARFARLKKRYTVKSDRKFDKRFSVPDFRQPGAFSVPLAPENEMVIGEQVRSVSTPTTTEEVIAAVESTSEPAVPHRATTTRRPIHSTLIDRSVLLLDSPVLSERPPPFETTPAKVPTAPPKQKNLSVLQNTESILPQFEDPPCVRPRTTDPRRTHTGKLKKAASLSSSDSSMSPLSAIKRRFSYTPPEVGSNLFLEDMKAVSIQATRIPEFSSAYDSKVPSPTVQVTIVDQLPHQKAVSYPARLLSMNSPSRRQSLAPVAEDVETRSVNEEFLFDQEEVLSYLQNDIYHAPTSVEISSPPATASDGGLPDTPPVTKSKFSKEGRPIDPSALIDELCSEFPYLLGNEDSFSLFESEALDPDQKIREYYGLAVTPDGSSVSFSGTRPVRTEFPPSPPQSEGRPGSDLYTQAALEELAIDSDSIRSVVDAINKASSVRSSFDYSDYDETDEADDDDNASNLEEPRRPGTALSFETDVDSIFRYSAPILRTGRSSYPGLDFSKPMLARSASQASRSTFLDDGEIAEVLSEPKRGKPELPPIITTPITPGQYGPPIKRRSHLRCRGKMSSPVSAWGGLDAVKPTLAKVVEEEMVEYTPVEEGADKGWVRQRRVSRAGEWVVVEREVIQQGAI